MIYKLGNKSPTMHGDYFIANGAQVMGEVDLGNCVSIWYNAVIRADTDAIAIGDYTNIQDGTVIHADPGSPVSIGKDVIVGHKAMIHGCTIGDNTLIGINAVILNGATIGKNCLIGANTLIPENKVIPDGSLVMGNPGKVVRELSEEVIQRLSRGAKLYWERALQHRNELVPM